ncbi:vegetative cell wall protein gp1-like isoform X2 [Herpailurus yagouaroundi]|uniref:vegetative cell wall protein gp1-like isoform X2 n=1 Tax=Herpailurus yagouaroundi TaxID=1608482 RepID=UPI001AD64F6C|nr:vegetative cell wall protein gp1-like isoform X2 [Puma yagouaroundi]
MAVCLPGRRMLLRFVQHLSDIQQGCVYELLGGESRRSGGQEARRLCEQDGEPESSLSSAPGLSYLGPAHLDPRPCSAHGEGGHRLQAGRGKKGETQTPRRSRLETETGQRLERGGPSQGRPGAPDTPPTPEPPPPDGVRPCPPWSALWSQSRWRTHSCCPRCPRGSVASGLRPPGPRPRLPLVSSLPPLLRPLTSGSKPHMRVLARTSPHGGPCPSARHQAGTSPVPGEHPSWSGAPPPPPALASTAPFFNRWQIPPTQTSE